MATSPTLSCSSNEVRVDGFLFALPAAQTPSRDLYVYVLREHRVYTLPEKNLALCKLDELYGPLTKTQKEYVDGGYLPLGTSVRCKVVDLDKGTLSSIIPNGKPLSEYALQDGSGFLLKTEVVFSADTSDARRCVGSMLEGAHVAFDHEFFQSAMPNVAYNGLIEIVVDSRGRGSYRLERIASVKEPGGSVAESQNLVTTAPWNRDRPVQHRYQALHNYDVLADAHEEYDVDQNALIREQITKEFAPPQEIFSGTGIVVARGEIFCVKVWQWRILVPWIEPDHRHDNWVGHVWHFESFYSPHNDALIVRRSFEKEDPIESEPSSAMPSVMTMATEVKPTGIGGVYWNPHVGYVSDSDLVLDQYDLSAVRSPWVYIRYNAEGALYKFNIDSIAQKHNPSSFVPSTTRDTYSGQALFVGINELLFVKELRHLRIMMRSESSTALGLVTGEFVDIVASRDGANKRVFHVTDIRRSQRPALSTRQLDGTIIMIEVTLTPSIFNPRYVLSDIFGPLLSTKKFLHATLSKCNTSVKGWAYAVLRDGHDRLSFVLDSFDDNALITAARALTR